MGFFIARKNYTCPQGNLEKKGLELKAQKCKVPRGPKTEPSKETLEWLKAAKETIERKKKTRKGDLAEIFPD